MDFSQIPLFSLVRERMSYLSQRQGVLAENVANADTPGYRAKDVQMPDFKSDLSAATHKLSMAVTSSKHMGGNNANAGQFSVIKNPSTDETTPNGNTVVITEEMRKMGQNQIEYQTATSIYRKSIDLIRAALGRPS